MRSCVVRAYRLQAFEITLQQRHETGFAGQAPQVGIQFYLTEIVQTVLFRALQQSQGFVSSPLNRTQPRSVEI